LTERTVAISFDKDAQVAGASWWLSRHWKTIYKHAKDKPFACITKYGSDDSTCLVHSFLSRKDVETSVKKLPNSPMHSDSEKRRLNDLGLGANNYR